MNWAYFDFGDFLIILVIGIIAFALGAVFCEIVSEDNIKYIEVEVEKDCNHDEDENADPDSSEEEKEVASGKVIQLDLTLNDDGVCGTVQVKTENGAMTGAGSCPLIVDNDQLPQLGDTARLYTVGKDYHVEVIGDTGKEPNPVDRGEQ